MSAARRVATVAGDPAREAELAQQLMDRIDVDLVMRCVDRVETLAVLRGGDLDALVAVGDPVWFDEELAQEVVQNGVRLVAVAPGNRHGPVTRVAIASLPADASAGDVVRAARRSNAPPPPPSPQPTEGTGRLIAVWGPKGAPGRTTVAVELARELASVDRSTLLIDGDPYGGDVLQSCGVVEDLPTVVWACRMAGARRLDAARVMTSLRRIDQDGPVLLPGLPRGDLWQEVSSFGWKQLLRVSKALFAYTVCDTGFCLETEQSPYTRAAERNMMTRTALEAADRVVAVCRGDEVGIKNFIWTFDALTEIAEPEALTVVANQVPPGEESAVGEVLRRSIGIRPIAYLAPRSRADEGRRSARRRDYGLRALAAALGAPVKPRGILTALSGRA